MRETREEEIKAAWKHRSDSVYGHDCDKDYKFHREYLNEEHAFCIGYGAAFDKLTEERDSALAKLKVAEDALEQIAGCSKPDVEVSSDSIEAENYIQNWAMTWDLATAALAAIRADAGPAKAETTCPMHGKTDCCCG